MTANQQRARHRSARRPITPLNDLAQAATGTIAVADAGLRGARRTALLVSPYFVPGKDTSSLLTGLAAQGLHVGVVTNSLAANDVVAVHGGYAKYRKPLLAGGVPEQRSHDLA